MKSVTFVSLDLALVWGHHDQRGRPRGAMPISRFSKSA